MKMKELCFKEDDQKSNGNEEEKEKDKHPEKRMKAAYKNFEEERLSEMKKEFPTLKLS
jgi:hypothetical protein